ncbi:MAG: hypothetical protein RLZZ490_662 [Cyanobacteriota bacterium]
MKNQNTETQSSQLQTTIFTVELNVKGLKKQSRKLSKSNA